MKRPAVLSLAVLLAGAVLWACGPYWPNFILGPDSQVFYGPRGIFKAELARLGNGDSLPFKAVPPPDDDPAGQTAHADAADLQEALTRLGVPAAQREDSVQRLAALRTQILEWGRTVSPPPLAVPAGLPPEFTLYLEGAVAWRRHRPAEAVRAWEKVLELPADQRRFRSTWAAFMLGKASLDDNPGEAVRRFRLTRELAAHGFADRLGLAASSVGWEARAEMDQGHPEKALVLYKSQLDAGDPTASASLSLASNQALGAAPEVLARVARDPQARAILTAWILSRDSGRAGDWLAALKAADVRDEPNADRIAWAAYLGGDFEQTAAWLDRAQESSPIARWLRARLLLRDGRLDEARELLAGIARDLPQTGMTLEEAFWYASESSEVLPAPQRAAGEEAVIRVVRKDFTGALDEFLRSGFWMDAAYLAEQVLTLDELKTYVDATWPADLAAKHPPADWETPLSGGYTAPPPDRIAYDLRYLLGRRLAREGRRKEALAYLPAKPQAALAALSTHLAAGRSGPRRAAELFEAACILRHQGMEVTGTEVEPDWSLFDGGYSLSEFLGDRLARRDNEIFPMSPEEAARVEKNRVGPRRYHYRYRAADLAWDAAKLLPHGDRKAEILATAGSWIKNRDPEAADRFYKELVRCCRATDLGREADELRWFPEADACAAKDGEDEE